MSWWEEALLFRKILSNAVTRSTTKQASFEDALDYIWIRTRINPSVIKKWKNGGNPSQVNLEKILKACNCSDPDTNAIIDHLHNFKRHQTETKPVTIPTEIVKLRAIVSEFNFERDKYWVRCYNGNKQIWGDCVTSYEYAPKFVTTPGFRAKVMEKLGHNKFEIEFDAKLSIPKRKEA